MIDINSIGTLVTTVKNNFETDMNWFDINVVILEIFHSVAKQTFGLRGVSHKMG